jgi:hypothetical protein
MNKIRFFIFLMCTADAMAQCNPIPGADALWSNRNLHWIFVGEMHGTNETPAEFANLVCDALVHGKHVTVGLEHLPNEESAINDLLTAKDPSEAQSELLHKNLWNGAPSMQGRSSKAMLKMILSMREMHQRYEHLRVVTFDIGFDPTQGPGARDEAMGKELLRIGNERPEDLIVILSGNFHAMQEQKLGYPFMAMFVPAERRISLEVTDWGGSSWTEINGRCGPNEGAAVGDKNKHLSRDIFLDASLAPFGKVDGVLSLGAKLTASAPANEEPNPLPECRLKYLNALKQKTTGK